MISSTKIFSWEIIFFLKLVCESVRIYGLHLNPLLSNYFLKWHIFQQFYFAPYDFLEFCIQDTSENLYFSVEDEKGWSLEGTLRGSTSSVVEAIQDLG